MRLFVAVYPPLQIARRLLSMLESLDLPEHRPVPAEQVHMTVLFIGEASHRELPDISESIHRSAAGLPPFELTLHALVALPERGPARLVAAETDAPPALRELQHRLAGRLARPDRHRVKAFLPHLTLARFPGAGRTLAEHAFPAPGGSQVRFVVSSVQLMSSVLKPHGAIHRPLEQVALTDRP